jgi:hypothetical protein
MRPMIDVIDNLLTYRHPRIGAVHCGSVFGGCCEYALTFSAVEYDIEFKCIASEHRQQLADSLPLGVGDSNDARAPKKTSPTK